MSAVGLFRFVMGLDGGRVCVREEVDCQTPFLNVSVPLDRVVKVTEARSGSGGGGGQASGDVDLERVGVAEGRF